MHDPARVGLGGVREGAGNGPERRRLAAKHVVIGVPRALLCEERDEAEDDHGARQDDAEPEDPAHLAREAALLAARDHTAPRSPWTIIWIPMTRTTAVKTRRRTFERAAVRIRAPSADPARTPRTAGAASAGSMYPRLR